jgi:hypothetical protein
MVPSWEHSEGEAYNRNLQAMVDGPASILPSETVGRELYLVAVEAVPSLTFRGGDRLLVNQVIVGPSTRI